MPPHLASKAAALALGAASWASAAHADTALPLQLEWSAPLECPTGAHVERDLRRITRIRPGRSLVALHARGQIQRDAERYSLTLEVDRHGERSQARFDSPTCAPLRKAATLVIALAFGDGVELQAEADDPVDAAPAPVASPPPASNTPSPERDVAPEAPHEAHAFRLVPWAGAALSSGMLGDSSLGLDLGLSVGHGWFSGFARASAFPPAIAAERNGLTATLSAIGGALGPCIGHPLSQARLDACVAFEATFIRAHSTGALHDGSTTAVSYGVAPALTALMPLTRPFSLRAELGIVVPLEAARYDIAPHGTLYSAARVVTRAALGLAVEL